MKKEKVEMDKGLKFLVFLAFLFLGAFVMLGINQLTGVSFKEVSFAGEVVHKAAYMVDGMVLLTMLKWLYQK